MKTDRTKLFTRIIRIVINVIYPIWLKRNANSFCRSLYRCSTFVTRHIMRCEPLEVVSHEKYCAQTPASSFTVIKANRTGYCGNMVFNMSRDKQELIPVKMDDVRLYEHHDVYVCGHSDVVVDEGKKTGINDFCYNKEDRLAYGDRFCLGQKGNMLLNKALDYKGAKRIKRGILISGLYSHNYYHAVLDNLIRLLVVNDEMIDRDAVYIVDENTMKIPSLCTIFKTLTKGKERDIVILKVRELLHCETLYYISHLNHIITNMNDWSKCQYSDYTFDTDYLSQMRTALLEVKSKGGPYPRRIFVSRKNMTRRRYNEDDVLNELRRYGFEPISPEEYSFEEQMAIFNNADFIIGSSGAAMTNLLFCKSKTKVLIILRNKGKDSDFPTLAYMNGCDCRYYCAIEQPAIKGSSGVYSVDTVAFMNCFHLLNSDEIQ